MSEVKCRQCGLGPIPQPRSGQRKDFCSTAHRTAWHNARRDRALALLADLPAQVTSLRAALVAMDDSIGSALDDGEAKVAYILVEQVLDRLQAADSLERTAR